MVTTVSAAAALAERRVEIWYVTTLIPSLLWIIAARTTALQNVACVAVEVFPASST